MLYPLLKFNLPSFKSKYLNSYIVPIQGKHKLKVSFLPKLSFFQRNFFIKQSIKNLLGNLSEKQYVLYNNNLNNRLEIVKTRLGYTKSNHQSRKTIKFNKENSNFKIKNLSKINLVN